MPQAATTAFPTIEPTAYVCTRCLAVFSFRVADERAGAAAAAAHHRCAPRDDASGWVVDDAEGKPSTRHAEGTR